LDGDDSRLDGADHRYVLYGSTIHQLPADM
jgi:hypothetical protein